MGGADSKNVVTGRLRFFFGVRGVPGVGVRWPCRRPPSSKSCNAATGGRGGSSGACARTGDWPRRLPPPVSGAPKDRVRERREGTLRRSVLVLVAADASVVESARWRRPMSAPKNPGEEEPDGACILLGRSGTGGTSPAAETRANDGVDWEKNARENGYGPRAGDDSSAQRQLAFCTATYSLHDGHSLRDF